MTDARLRGEWLGNLEFDLLSDRAWRVFTGALMWCAQNGTDGFIPDRYHNRLHPDGANLETRKAEKELTDAGLWEKTRHQPLGKGYQLIDWDGFLGQSTAEQVETYKANARERQRRYRERERSKLEKRVMSDVTRHVGKGTGEGEREGEGDHRVGSAVPEVDSATGEVLDSGFEVTRDGNKVSLNRVAS